MTPHHVHCVVMAGTVVLPLARGVAPVLLAARVRQRRTKSPQFATTAAARHFRTRRDKARQHGANRDIERVASRDIHQLVTVADMELEFVTKKQAAEIAHVTERTVLRWIAEKKLSRKGSPGQLLIDVAELRDFLSRGPTRRPGPGKK